MGVDPRAGHTMRSNGMEGKHAHGGNMVNGFGGVGAERLDAQKRTAPPGPIVALGIGVIACSLGAFLSASPDSITFSEAARSDSIPTELLLMLRLTAVVLHGALPARQAPSVRPGLTQGCPPRLAGVVLLKLRMRPGLHFLFAYKSSLGSRLKNEQAFLPPWTAMKVFFTVWTYSLEGIYFCFASVCSAAALAGAEQRIPLAFVRVLHLTFEVSASCALLVTIVVSFVIW